jgi:hypothetical protein
MHTSLSPGCHMLDLVETYCFPITATSEILPDLRPARKLAKTKKRAYHPMVGRLTSRAPGQFIVITNEISEQKSRARIGYSRLPGTRIKRQQSAASTTAIHARHISARLLSSFLIDEVSILSHDDILKSTHTSQKVPSLSRSS